MRPRFRNGEVVRLPAGAGRRGEAVVDDFAGPDDDGSRWLVHAWIGDPGGPRSLWTFPEDELEATGLVEDSRGERVEVSSLPPAEERFDVLRLVLVTGLTDGIQVAETVERFEGELRRNAGPVAIEVEAERHWLEPYCYELEVTARPLGDPVSMLRAIAETGGEGWLLCTDDGWRCDLWWSADEDETAVFFVPEVVGAEVAFLPWSSPARRPSNERPLVSV